MNYQIALRDETSETVEGDPIGKYFAARHLPYESDGVKYVIDHVPTGFAMAFTRTKAQARRVVQILNKFDIPWELDDQERIKAQIEATCLNLLIDLAMDGIIYADMNWLNDKVAELKATGWQHTCYQKLHKEAA